MPCRICLDATFGGAVPGGREEDWVFGRDSTRFHGSVGRPPGGRRARAETARTGVSVGLGEWAVTGPKILIIEDDPALEAVDFGAHFEFERTDGISALRHATRTRPDLLVLNLENDLDSLSLCRKLRAQDPLRLMRVLLILSAARPQDRLLGYDAGADDVLERPVDGRELCAKAKVFLGLQPRQQVEELKSGILAMVAHETRTPLTGVLSSAELLLGEDTMEDHERRHYVETIQECGERLASLLERVMKLSAIKSDAWELRMEPHSLMPILAEATFLVQGKAFQADVHLHTVGGTDVEVLTDARELGECLFSVLDNAVRHAPPGSMVQIEVARDAGDVLISIRDFGVGIAVHMHDVIFEEFTSCDILHHGGGNGLSLAIARQVLSRMGGDIEVVSQPGEGAIFTVRVPAARDDAREDREGPPGIPVDPSRPDLPRG